MTRKAPAAVSAEEKAQRTKPLSLAEWLQQPTASATRQQVYLVAKLLATTAVATEREQAKYRKWYRRLWAAVQRLFAPAQVQVEIGKEPLRTAEDAGDDSADDTRPAELAAEKEHQKLESGVQFRDRRATREPTS